MSEKKPLFMIYDKELGRKRPMTVKEIGSFGVADINQPLPIKGSGREIEGTIAGYVIVDKRIRTYDYDDITWWKRKRFDPKLYPVTIEINNKNTGYHYYINFKEGKSL